MILVSPSNLIRDIYSKFQLSFSIVININNNASHVVFSPIVLRRNSSIQVPCNAMLKILSCFHNI